MSRKWLSLLFALILLAGGAGFAWHVALGRLEAGVAAWAEARRAEGWQVRHAAPARSPLPWRPELRLADAELVSPLGLGFRAGALRVAFEPWRPDRLALRAEGPVAAGAGGAWQPVEARDLTGDASLRGDDVIWLAEGLAAGGGGADRAALRWREGHATLTAEGARVGPLRLDLLSVLARVDGGAAFPEGWRNGGGALQVLKAEARRGEALAELTARITLDGAMQPQGSGQLALHNPAEIIRVARDAGAIPPSAATGLALAAQLGARVPPGGGPPRLDLPLELRGRRLTAARFPVATLPEIAWR